MQSIIVINANKMSFMGNDGKQISGVSVDYVFTDSLSPVAQGNFLGYPVLTAWLSDASFPSLSAVPAVYDGTFESRIKKGQVIQKLASVDFVRNI